MSGTAMNATGLIRYIDQIEATTLILPALLLLFVGNKVVESHPGPRTIVSRVVALVFFAVLTGELYLHWPVPGEILTEIILRSLLLGGLFLGGGWIVAPAISALYQGGIVTPCKVICRTLSALVRGLFRLITHPVRFFRDQSERKRQIVEQERLRKETEKSAKEYAADQKRREDARAACELLFHRHSHVLTDRFTKETFADFISKYMGDGRPPDDVEERGSQLREIILQHVHQIEPPKKPYTIESLAEWYRATKELIDSLPVEARYKQAQMAQLNARYAELMQSLMESLQP